MEGEDQERGRILHYLFSHSVVAVPLGISMISVGGHSLQVDFYNNSQYSEDVRCSKKCPQDCEALVNHTDTEVMVSVAHLAKEIHTENTGILRCNIDF